ncbi:MAG: phosphopentomutase [Anaerovoracaceae bacterium]
MRRAIIIVMDSLGVGYLPDAEKYGDKGANTFGTIVKEYPQIKIPNLKKLGFCNINGLNQVLSPSFLEKNLIGSFGKLNEMSVGKDTITGHFEIAGILTEHPFKTYPDGFPSDFIKLFEEEIGCEVIGNYPESGTVIIDKLGEEHEKTGKPIVYTSADSVFQIAVNVDIIPLERLYEICQIARNLLVGKWACGRVIARPYQTIKGKRVRTSDRKDYAVSPPRDTMLNNISNEGQRVYGVGKINDIFNGSGITETVHSDSNNNGVDQTITAINEDFEGLIFTNLVDFDSKYGHRRDPIGYGKAIEDFDNRLPEILRAMKDEDILFICADHGNDPDFVGYDHTREYIPLVIYGQNIKPGVNLDIRNSFADIGATICQYLSVNQTEIGESFLKQILK